MSRQLRFFQRLVRVLFPADFRADYESEMTRTFRAQHRDATGARALLDLWLDTLSGFLRTAPREHLAQLTQDVRYTLRMMRRTPAFSAIAIATLAIGIGANTAMFSVVHAVLMRQLPYADAGSLFVVWDQSVRTTKGALSEPEVLDFRERLRGVELGAWANGSANLLGFGDPMRLRTPHITANLLSVLRVQPSIGRTFRPEEERPGQGRVMLISDALWRQTFGADPGVVGRRVVVDGEPVIIVGVLPAGFVMPNEFGADERSSALRPLTLDPAADRSERGGHYLFSAARLRPGVSMVAAQAEIDSTTKAFERENPGEYDQGFGTALTPIRTEIAGDVRPALLVLVGAVAMVLLIACANVANLLVARGRVRAREIAVRKAIGASQARLVRQVMTESLVLAAASAAAGIVLAQVITRIMARAAPGIPRIDEVGLDPVVLAFTLGVSALTALLFGSLPAIQLAQGSVSTELHGERGTKSSLRAAARSALVAVQTALALVLLVGAALLIQSFTRLLAAPSGFRPERVLTFRLTLPPETYRERDRIVRFYEQFIERVRTLPGVTRAGAVGSLPLQAPIGDWDFYMPGEVPGPHGSDRPAFWQVVTPGYFEAMGIGLRRGRYFSASDSIDAQPVVAIGESLAKTYFAGRDAVGQQIRMSGGERPWLTIIGVVDDVRHKGLDEPANAQLYLPHAQFVPFWKDTTMRSFAIVVRTAGDPLALAALVRAQVRELDSNLPISQVNTMERVLERSVAPQRLNMLLLATFALVALVLATVGTYGVLAYQVTERTREIGVRMALGAKAADILRMVLRQGMLPAAIGLAIGLVGATMLTRLLTALLFETKALDPATFATAAAVLFAAALVACCVPARRAARVDPSIALRAE